MKKNNPVNIFYFNREVHNLLPRTIDRHQLVNRLDQIISVEKWQENVTFYITEKYEFENLQRLYDLIHHNKLIEKQIVFYTEIPELLYRWIKHYSFKDIINQITMYFAYLSLEKDIRHSNSSELINDTYEIIKPRLLEMKLEMKKIVLTSLDKKKFYSVTKNLFEPTEELKFIHLRIKYLKYFSENFKDLPPKHLVNYKTEYQNYFSNYDLIIYNYGSRKGFNNIDNNRWSNPPDGPNYTSEKLNIWKKLYKENIRQEYNFYENFIQVINFSKKPNAKKTLECTICFTYLEFEQQSSLSIPDDHEYICHNCYLNKYFG